MKIYDVIVIGGGASGLVAAIEAGKHFERVALLEKESRMGKKILATGNGKCNLTNINANIKDYSGSLCYGVKRLFSEYSPKDIIKYFENMGLVTYADEFGRVYPKCNQASAVLDTLRNNIRLNDIDEFTECKVTDIVVGENFEIVTNNERFFSKIGAMCYSTNNNGINGFRLTFRSILQPRYRNIPRLYLIDFYVYLTKSSLFIH